MKAAFLAAIITALLVSLPVFAQETEYEKGAKAYMDRDYETAVVHLREHVSRVPDAKAYYMLGYSFYALERAGRKEFAHSAEYFRQAYMIEPGFDPASVLQSVTRE
jgi:TolA-binding protein